MDWKQYENKIAEYFRSEYLRAKITSNAKIVGRFSKVERQIDLLIEDSVCDFEFRIVVDGKYRDKKIDVNDVESFIGFLRDISAHKGLMISTEGYTTAAINRAFYEDLDLELEGYTTAAINRAFYEDLDLELDVLNFKELHQFHAFWAIPYAGNYGVVLPAPLGWVIDGTRRGEVVATLYQRGHDLESAAAVREWMYVNFWGKDQAANDLDSLLKLQESNIKREFPGAEIEYQEGPHRSDAKTRLRLLKISTYPAPEYTGFVEFDGFIFFCVLFTPTELENKNLRKLRYILRSVLPLGIRHRGTVQ